MADQNRMKRTCRLCTYRLEVSSRLLVGLLVLWKADAKDLIARLPGQWPWVTRV